MKSSMEKSPGWLRGVQIGLGIITVILAIYALAFPAVTFLGNSNTGNNFVHCRY